MDLPSLVPAEGEITVSLSASYSLLPSWESRWLVCEVSHLSSSVRSNIVLISLRLDDLDVVEIVDDA